MPATDAVTGKATYFSKYDIIRDNYKIIEDIDHRCSIIRHPLILPHSSKQKKKLLSLRQKT